jgi:hypothetical protein
MLSIEKAFRILMKVFLWLFSLFLSFKTLMMDFSLDLFLLFDLQNPFDGLFSGSFPPFCPSEPR